MPFTNEIQIDENNADAVELAPGIMVYDGLPSEEEVLEAHEDDNVDELPIELKVDEATESDGVEINNPTIIVVNLDDIPGAPDAGPIEVEEKPSKKEEKSDSQDAKDKAKVKDSKWSWESFGFEGFVSWINTKLKEVPKHTGRDTAGIERAIAYLSRLDSEISKAMRSDIDGELDAQTIEDVREKIEDGLDRLKERLDQISDGKKKGKIKKNSSESYEIVKEAGTPTIQGIVVTVPLLIHRLARVLINGTVSAGHDISDMFVKLVKKYDLTKREQAELQQLVADMGYPVSLMNRGFAPGEEFDLRDGDFDFASNYQN